MLRVLSLTASLAVLAGCQSTYESYAELEKSSAEISNVRVTEMVNPVKRRYKIKAEFDYEITDFIDDSNLYVCSILFYAENDKMYSKFSRSLYKDCQLTVANGSAVVIGTSPEDKDWDGSPEDTPLLTPLRYNIAIHQMTAKLSSQVIGSSPCFELGSVERGLAAAPKQIACREDTADSNKAD